MRRCAVLGNGVIGAEKQALALAEAVGLRHTLHRILPPRATRWLPTAGQLATDLLPAWSGLRTPRLGPPHPALAISCGRASIPASIALRADSGGRTLTVHVQRPLCAATHFDLVIAPAHDYAGETPPSNVLLTDGSLHDVCDATLRTARGEWEPRLRGLPRPRLAVLLGGAMRRRWWQRPLAPELTVPRGRQLLREAVAAVAPLRGSVMLAASRRTPPEVAAAATREMEDAGAAAGVATMAWAADASPSPYAGLLGCSDYLLVSADSVNMTSEAIGTAKPVYVAGGGECARRLGHFHALAAAGRRTRPWAGALEPAELWAAPPASEPTDVQRAAARVLELLQARGSMSCEFTGSQSELGSASARPAAPRRALARAMAEAPPLSPEEAYAGMLGNGGGSRTVARSVRLGVAGTILTASVLLAMLTYAIKGLPGTKLEWGQWSLHPVLMTLAFGFLAPIAATSYRGFEHIGGMSHAKAKLLHAFMQGMALLCGILGTRTMWIAHGKVGPDFHLISVHSWLGLAALIAFAFQWASGLAVFYTPLVERLTTRRGWLPFHVFIGCFATFGTLASVALGLLSFSYTKGGTPASYTTPSQIQFKVCALLVMLLCGFVGMIFATPRRGF